LKNDKAILLQCAPSNFERSQQGGRSPQWKTLNSA
jgi:hypothetical protein